MPMPVPATRIMSTGGRADRHLVAAAVARHRGDGNVVEELRGPSALHWSRARLPGPKNMPNAYFFFFLRALGGPILTILRNLANKGSGVAIARSMTDWIFSAETGLTIMRRFFASARKAGSFTVATNAFLSAATRSAGTPGGAKKPCPT